MRCRQSRSWWGMMALLAGGLLWTPLTEPALARSQPLVAHRHAPQSLQGERFFQLGRGLITREAGFGSSVALSSDGSVAVISAQNSAYVFTRSGSAWNRQATLPDGGAAALSADGNTALIGGRASHIFIRSGSTWTEQATLSGGANGSALSADGNTALMGNGAVFTRAGKSWSVQATLTEGETVALSADGSTALIGTGGHGSIRTLTIFARSGSTWTRQFEERSGEPNPPYATTYASSAALSADGNTAVMGIVGLLGDTIEEGASSAVLFTRSGSTWTRQEEFAAGASVGLSADGNTALLGAPVFCGVSRCWLGPPGQAFAFTRSGTTWDQGQRLEACEVTNRLRFEGFAYGEAVALSADGSTALIGDRSHHSQGAAWFFRRGLPPPPPPVITSVSPKSGPPYGEIVKIRGTNLCSAEAVNFGGVEGEIVSNSATGITVESPGGEPGIVDVAVTTPGGTSAISELDHYRYRKK
jgi:IPT/TIG domain